MGKGRIIASEARFPVRLGTTRSGFRFAHRAKPTREPRSQRRHPRPAALESAAGPTSPEPAAFAAVFSALGSGIQVAAYPPGVLCGDECLARLDPKKSIPPQEPVSHDASPLGTAGFSHGPAVPLGVVPRSACLSRGTSSSGGRRLRRSRPSGKSSLSHRGSLSCGIAASLNDEAD